MTDSGVSSALIGVIGAVLCAFLSAAVASSRGLHPGGYFVLGLLLGVFGILIAAVAKGPATAVAAPQPPGWYPDPWGQAWLRWYDGYQWTWQMHNGDVPTA